MPTSEVGFFTLRPFHEAVVDIIRAATLEGLACLAMLIRKTKIPKGHDEIIAAWNHRLAELGSTLSFGVVASLQEQKQASAKKPEGEKKSVNNEELIQETERLLSLLKERECGMFTWHEAVHERLDKMHELIRIATGKE